MAKVILYVIGFFFLISGVDYAFGNHIGLGRKFEEGIKTMGTIGIAMIGIYSIAPLMAGKLGSLIIPLSNRLNLDPSIFTGCLLAPDMGGYQISTALAGRSDIGAFSAVVIASTLGTTVSFTIPIAMSMISKEDQGYFAKGALAGIITIPLGCLVGGLYLGINPSLLIWNLMPITILAVALALGLLFFPGTVLKFYEILGRVIMVLSICGLLLQGLDSIIGVRLIEGLAPINETMTVVGKIALVLGGAYPMLTVINKVFKPIFERLGERVGINAAGVCGIIGNLASNLLIFSTYEDMNPRGKVVAAAFGVSAAFIIGGQMGFISGVAPGMLGAFVITKLVGGAASVTAALWMLDREEARFRVAERVQSIKN
jgi:ethanolamine transporter